jgi:hypothetical protein
MKRQFQTGDSIALSVDRHARLHGAILQAERLAAFTLTTIRGRTASEVAAEVASRAVAALKAKVQPEGQARP